MTDPAYLPRQDGERIAYRRMEGRGPGILWLGGFHSDMNGTKAQAMADWAQRSGRGFVRFDYFGHGASSGERVARGPRGAVKAREARLTRAGRRVGTLTPRVPEWRAGTPGFRYTFRG